ncbi:MAG TPA: Crp/Fnr family transcriptional regulator [Candidatus Saccharimonadales bacterium]
MSQHAIIRQAFAEDSEKHYSKGEIILRPGEHDHVYFIKSGFVKAYTISSQGFYTLLSVQSVNEIIPIQWIFHQYRPDLFYEAMTDSKVLVMPTKQLKVEVIHRDELHRAIFDQMLATLELYSERIHNLGLRSSTERIAFRLIDFSRRFGRQIDEDSTLLVIPISYQDVADALNMTRETANREFLLLMKEGIIERRGQQILIKDAEALRQKLEQ